MTDRWKMALIVLGTVAFLGGLFEINMALFEIYMRYATCAAYGHPLCR